MNHKFYDLIFFFAFRLSLCRSEEILGGWGTLDLQGSGTAAKIPI